MNRFKSKTKLQCDVIFLENLFKCFFLVWVILEMFPNLTKVSHMFPELLNVFTWKIIKSITGFTFIKT